MSTTGSSILKSKLMGNFFLFREHLKNTLIIWYNHTYFLGITFTVLIYTGTQRPLEVWKYNVLYIYKSKVICLFFYLTSVFHILQSHRVIFVDIKKRTSHRVTRFPPGFPRLSVAGLLSPKVSHKWVVCEAVGKNCWLQRRYKNVVNIKSL